MQSLCKPALLYLFLEAINDTYLLIAQRLGVFHAVFKVLFIFVWVVVLQIMYFFFGWETFTWFVVVFPYFAYTVLVIYVALYTLQDKVLADNFHSTQKNRDETKTKGDRSFFRSSP